jgi:PAS domain S-box-containing protein
MSNPLQLGEHDELLILAQEAGGLGIFEWQVQAGTVRVSSKLMSIYGMTQFDGRYETWLSCLYREDRIRYVDILETAFAEKAHNAQAEFRIVRATDGEMRWIEARRIIFYDADGKPGRVVGVSVDITDRKRNLAQLRAFAETLEERVRERTRELEAENEARRKAEESLRQAQKMEAVGQLTGGIAHDFNNLLTIILGGLDVIRRQIGNLPPSPATARIERSRDMAVQGAQRAATLTSRLLAFSRQQPLAPKPIDANRLVADVCELLRRTLGEPVALETVLAGGLWQINADGNQLENALVNLAVNARDAMPGGGKMTIETANCYLDDAYVSSLTEPLKTGQYVQIAVTDTGTGMDASTLEHVFEPFFTTKEVGKGTGLGLSQVYGFVHQSAGHVKIYSEVGHGSMVKIYLPRHLDADARPDVGTATPGAAEVIGRESILVVEDDDALRAYTTEILNELGYRVLQAPNGAAALDIIEREPEIDLLFTDIVMPGGINGKQLADEALLRRPKLKVLFTTGYTRNAIVHRGQLDPGVQLISKPFSFNELSAKVRTILVDGPE